MIHANPSGWRLLSRFSVGSGEASLLKDAFTVASNWIFPTFRIGVENWTSGQATIDLRFGFETADATVIGSQGLTFPVLVGANQWELQSVTYGVLGAGADVLGNPLSILPPRVVIYSTTTTPAVMDLALYGAWLDVE